MRDTLRLQVITIGEGKITLDCSANEAPASDGESELHCDPYLC